MSAVINDEHTAATFAQAIDVDKDAAYGFLRFLVAKGLAENLGAKQAPGKKGRGEIHYRVRADAPDAVAKLIKVAFGWCEP
jgi:predicted ArsR family transcriptional regulator